MHSQVQCPHLRQCPLPSPEQQEASSGIKQQSPSPRAQHQHPPLKRKVGILVRQGLLFTLKNCRKRRAGCGRSLVSGLSLPTKHQSQPAPGTDLHRGAVQQLGLCAPHRWRAPSQPCQPPQTDLQSSGRNLERGLVFISSSSFERRPHKHRV